MNGRPLDSVDRSLVVSVVIPTYNAAATIAEQLAALERQVVPGEWEIVIALQPCTDETEGEIARCASERVRVVEAFGQRGPSYARNVGAAAARSSLIAFCDADDIAADDWLGELLSHASAPVVAGGAVEFEEATDLDDIDLSTVDVPGIEYDFLQSVYTNSMLVHQSVFEAIGGFDVDLSHCEDTDLAWKAQLAGYEIATAPSAIMFYRQRGSRRDRWLQYHRWCRAVPALYRRHRAHGMPRTEVRQAARDWLWLATRVPFLVHPAYRRVWSELSARRAGHLVGSVRERCLYL